MRILVVSDLHGNRDALDAVVREPHDMVICLGDIVGYGPEPHACVEWVRDHADWVVQGNHDRANADGVPPRCRPNFAWLADAVAPWTRAQLDDADRAYLHRLPRWIVQKVDGMRVACFHAAPSDPLYAYVPGDAGVWARELDRVDAEVVLVGHTHVPLDVSIGGRRVLNPGSVGQPKHGDCRAAYLLLTDGVPELKRVSYNVEDTVRKLEQSCIALSAVRVLADVLRSGRAPAGSPIAGAV